MRVRGMIMAAQIDEFRGVTYPPLETPLMPVAQPEGDPIPPGWIARIDYWANQSEGISAMIWGCIQDFEDKYWRMVEDAQNADFWKPAASISE